MQEDSRYIKIHFLNDKTMTFTFPQQVEATYMAGALRNMQNAPQLLIKTDERFYMFPWTSIKFIEAIPVPEVDIQNCVQGAELLASTD